MDAFTMNDLKALLEGHPEPCLSLYLPTERGLGEKNAVRWRTQLHAAERLLLPHMTEEAAHQWLAPAWRLQNDVDFWRHQGDGFAWFQTGDFQRSYRLPIPFLPKVICAAHFRLTPLLDALGDNGGFFVLAISQKRVRLLHGTRFGLEEVELTNVPASLADALRFDVKEEVIDFHGVRPGTNGAGGSVFYGQGGGYDEHKTDLLRYFQMVDRGLHELLRNERAPLFLAAVEYLWPIYRQANTYPHLEKAGIAGNPDHLPAEKLHQEAWQLAAPLFQKPRVNALEKYAEVAGKGYTVEHLEDVLLAAHQGLVDTLFLDREAEWYGVFDEITGSLVHNNPQPSSEEELLNLAALYTLRHGGKVWTCPPREGPRRLPVAAIVRAPLGARRQLATV